MRIKYKYVIHKLTSMKNMQSKDYLNTLLAIMDSLKLKTKSKTKKSQSIKNSKRKTKRSSSLN